MQFLNQFWRAARETGDAGRMLEAASEWVDTAGFYPVDPKESLQIIGEVRDYAASNDRIQSSDPRWIVATAYHGLALCRTGDRSAGPKLAQEAVAAARITTAPIRGPPNSRQAFWTNVHLSG